MTHTGLWVSANGDLSVRQLQEISLSTLAAKQYLVRVAYSGINPADKKHSLVLKFGDRVAGYDAVGTIISCGPSTSFQPGTSICLLSRTGVIDNAHLYGSHQQFLIADEEGCFLLSPNISPEIAATVPVVAATAADCLFSLLKFNPAVCEANRVPLLIWGGSSAVGNAAIQFAKAVGIWPILVTASAQHHAALLERGATKCFDYKNPNVHEEVMSAVVELSSGQRLCHGMDATGQNAGDIISLCNYKDAVLVSTAGGPHNLPKAFAAVIYGCDIKLGNGITVPGRPQDVEIVRQKVQWALDNLGVSFQHVPTELVEGGWEGLKEHVEMVAMGRASFRKYAFRVDVN